MAFIKYTTGEVKTAEQYYQCACYSDEHMVKVYQDFEDNQVYLIIALRKFGFFRRLWAGIKYILGYECKFGHFDEFIFQSEDVTCFRKVLEQAEIKIANP